MNKKQVVKDALWVDVGDYTVLRDGRIFKRNWGKTGKTQEVGQNYNKQGYLQFTYNGKTVRSHRFIAEAFISNPENLPAINHKDEQHSTPNDNSPLNLEWCDYAYNNAYGSRTKRAAASKSKTVYQYTPDGKFIREWQSATVIRKQLGYNQSLICFCCLGKSYHKTAYGYRWSYDPPR